MATFLHTMVRITDPERTGRFPARELNERIDEIDDLLTLTGLRLIHEKNSS